MIIGFVALSIIPALATFSPIMRAWLWPHLAWAYALGLRRSSSWACRRAS